MASPPPLPPRDSSQLPSPPPPYSEAVQSQENASCPSILDSKVPRPSSSQSLAPSRSDSDGRRTLLLVYIHGFYGNDQSFQSFPAHVHNVLREALAETHAVYSKVYPRYKTYKSIEVARDNFSAWLEPHESPTTDVILVGHSMGGLLAAEVVLTPRRISSSRQPLRHRILGSLSLDSPFLGLHPGIVASGISSLFHPAPTPPNQDAASSPPADLGPSSPASVNTMQNEPRDPNFDPPYFNDSPFKEQPFLTRMLHFGSKHWNEGIFTALSNHVAAHLEFGGCLADYPGLKSRYSQLRALEDIDDFHALKDASSGGSRNRVRFLNYYTLSPGRPKRPAANTTKGSRDTSQVDLSAEPAPEIKIEDEINDRLVDAIISAKLEDEEKNQADASLSEVKTPVNDNDGDVNKTATTASEPKQEDILDNHNSSASKHQELREQSLDTNRLSMQSIEPIPMDEAQPNSTEQEPDEPPPSPSTIETKADEKFDENSPSEKDQHHLAPNINLPPIPDLPNPPEQPDLSHYADKDSRKQAEKEFSRRQKTHDQAAKDRAKAIRERERLLDKLQRKAQKDADKLKKQQQHRSEQDKKRLEKEEEKAAKADKKKRLEKETAAAKQQQLAHQTKSSSAAAAAVAASSTSSSSSRSETEAETPGGGKPKKLGKFCTTPHKTNGAMDPAWVRVFMDGMDEVTAHCGLFFPGPHYDRLVGDVSGRIVSWVQDDLSVRAVLDMGPD